jgi:hypothetical protein
MSHVRRQPLTQKCNKQSTGRAKAPLIALAEMNMSGGSRCHGSVT